MATTGSVFFLLLKPPKKNNETIELQKVQNEESIEDDIQTP